MNFLKLLRSFTKDGLLNFSALLTWLLVSFIYLRRLDFDQDFLLKTLALVSFISLFFHNVSFKKSILAFSLVALIQVILIWLLIYFDNYQIIPILFALVASQLAANFSRAKAISIILLINIGYYFVLMQAQPDQTIYTVLIFFVLQVFAFAVIEATLREARAKEKLAAINQELLATRFMLKETSKKQERLRISRDLHDVLGHQLTALALNLEVTNHKVPDKFKPLTHDNLKQAKQLLHDVRNVVKKMRNEDQLDITLTLKALVQQLPNCQLDIMSAEQNNAIVINSLTLTNQLVFCLQEGISNALRHGRADNFMLKFNKDGSQLTFQLTDNGSGCDNIKLGNGLHGMQERLANFKGKIELIGNNHPQASGCTLKIQVEDTYD